MRQIIYFLIFCCGFTGKILAQPDINYSPPALIKVLSGLNRTPEPRLGEVMFPVGMAYQTTGGKFFTVERSAANTGIRYVYIGRVNSCRSGVCFADQSKTGKSDSEYFDYFMLFNEEGVVQLVRVYNYQATHGQEISAPNWLKQFVGYKGTNGLAAGKNIDAISGATISVEGIVADVQQKTKILDSFLHGE